MQQFLATYIDEYLSRLRTTASTHQHDAAVQALAHFSTALSAYHDVPVAKLTLSHIRVGGFHSFVDHLQSTLSVESEHLYSRATLDFLTYLHNQSLPDLPLDELSDYLAAHRRPKSHDIQPPPLRILAKVASTAYRTPLPIDIDSERDTLRFLRDKAFILTLADTGAKLSALCDMRVRHLRAQLADSTGTAQSRFITAVNAYFQQRRTLDNSQILPPEDLPVFARHDKRASDQILPISRWTGANIINYWLDLTLNTDDYDYLEHHDYAITSQSFRDAFIIRMLHRSADVQSVMESVGHADQTTTRRYLTLVEQLKDELEALA